jgi:hypothetical protein
MTPPPNAANESPSAFPVDEAITKANTLIEAMGWIRNFAARRP